MLGGYHTYLSFEELECDTDERFLFDLKLLKIEISEKVWKIPAKLMLNFLIYNYFKKALLIADFS